MSANDTQVGGEHYRKMGTLIQHWDLSVMFMWDPFQYQITKYVMRWKDKHATFEQRLSDLKKAKHFLDKYIEEAESFDKVMKRPAPAPDPAEHKPQFTWTSMAQEDSNKDFQCEGFYGDHSQLYKCKHCGTTQIQAKNLTHAYEVHGACALAHGYLNQP